MARNTKAPEVKKVPSKRTRKAPKYKSFRLAKRIRYDHKNPVPGIYRLYKQTISLLLGNKKLFLGILGVHIILTLIFVSGFGQISSFSETRQGFQEAFGENSSLATSIALFSFLVSSGSSTETDTGGIYQLFLTIIVSLVLIWSIRQIYAGDKPTVKQSFYSGVYPLVPFILVLLVVVIQLVPLMLGSFLVSTVFSGGLAVSAPEQILWVLLFILLALLSLYMITSSIFALFIVTLPNMMPMKALRSARELVLHRRFSVMLRVAGLPIDTLFLFAVILLPVIFLVSFLAVPIFIFMSSLALFIVIAYMYNLYRALL